MFLRRKKISWPNRLRELVWPAAGWQRTLSYLFHRMARLPGSPYFVAAGFACGAAVSFTPVIGTHFVLGCLLAWVLRASLLASVVGTFVGNPWTFPFIWIWIYKLGHWILDEPGVNAAYHFDFSRFFGTIIQAFLRLDMVYLFETAWPVLWPMTVGGIPTAIVAWFVFYIPLKPMVAAYQHRRLIRRMKKVYEGGKNESAT